jgi:hypothetical protein
VHGAGSVIVFVVLLVVVVQALIWIPLIIWMRRRKREAYHRLSSEMASETVIRPPEKASYRGATAPNYPIVKRYRGNPTVANDGVIALSKRRLAFITLTRKSIEIPVSEIRGVHEAKVFKRSVQRGKTHLVIELPSGEVGFYVADNAAWISAVKDACLQ